MEKRPPVNEKPQKIHAGGDHLGQFCLPGAPGGHFSDPWTLLGRPWAPRVGATAKKVVRSPRSWARFGGVFSLICRFLAQNCRSGAFFFSRLFLQFFWAFFDGFLGSWNHKNTNYSWEGHQNHEILERVSGAPSGAILGVIFDHFWVYFGALGSTLDVKKSFQMHA